MSIPSRALFVALSISALQGVAIGCKGSNVARDGEQIVQPVDLGAESPQSSTEVAFRVYTSFPQREQRLIAFVVRSGSELVRVELGSVDEIARRVAAWRAAIGAPSDIGAAPEDEGAASSELAAGRALREMLLDPVLVAVGEEVSELLVSPHDVVHLVPLDALPNAVEGCVGDRVRITLLGSGTTVVSPLPQESEPSLLALGDPAQGVDADPSALRSASVASASPAIPRSIGFQPLPGAAREVEAVGRCFQQAFDTAGVVLTGEAATQAEFVARAPSVRFLHVATHGWFAPELLDSFASNQGGNAPVLHAPGTLTGFASTALCGLAFAGANQGRDKFGRVPGILTADELAGLDLESCELAVLAASESNVGLRRAGQGVESLQKALHMAGARSTITSLWKVDDAATCELMERFYEHLWIEELPTAEALWRAKSDLRAAGHPTRDWAAWVLSAQRN